MELQLLQGQYHRERADQNRVALIPIPADRGNILDRNGKLLATNQLSRSLYLHPREQTEAQWQAIAQQLAPLLQISQNEILARLKQAGYRSAVPVRLLRNIPVTTYITVAEKQSQFPGLEIRAESSRNYPNGNLAAHIIGYIGEVTNADVKRQPNYPIGMIVGQTGIERQANDRLEGRWGSQLTEVDATGQAVSVLGDKPAIAGLPIQLTLDVTLQIAAERALKNRRGAVVVLDSKTGGILTMASGPTFDPNLFTRRISTTEWKKLQSQDNPFLNRAMQGYPPGSTFKILTAIAGIESGKFSPEAILPTYPSISLGGHQFHEHGGASYGAIGFGEALTVSSNTFFYQIGLAAGPSELAKWGRRLGIGSSANLLEGKNDGSIPTPEEKEKLFGEPWYGGDTVSMSIGQGLVQMTPLEMAVMIAAIANGGYRVKPHLLAEQTSQPNLRPEKLGINAATLAVIRDGLVGVVKQGTARRLNDGSIPLTAGKTGTAEVPGQKDNAVYVGFAPADKPKIAVAIVVENGGYGAESAVPIAHEIYKTYFKRANVPSGKKTLVK
jgi:penicillin-binding protein 2